MRKLLLAALAATVLTPSIAAAQSAGEVRRDQREVARDQREVERDLAKGHVQEAREDGRETARDQRETNEDWQDYRRSHRHVYDRSAYVAPRGHRYHPVTEGARLDRVYWGSRYRINNYSRYRLHHPGYHQAYVRYGNDVLLVNTRTGHVIRVYNNFFF